ncbi:MAG: hypothetical protein A3E80_05620 [Chlamydiae bacterium RIFCSPHIGHO2_12_FULL_49_9]|nr:MAG: hypothetical protein A3E80_05620 [Chlamydiae bacterium RIFCSPHIGHO2_12_FULL_49_9]
MNVGDSDGGSDHVICMKEIFQTLKPRSLLEFGLGYSTKYFLDSCKRVVSVEVITHGYGPNRLQNFIRFYRDYSNWIPIAYFSGFQGDMSWAPYKYLGSDAVYIAGSYQCATHQHYKPIDDFYIKELGEFVSNLVKFNKIEVALIHPTLFLRGDIVESCFRSIPVVVAHNTACRQTGEGVDGFGFKRIVTPPEYEEIYVPTPNGTTVWIIKKPEYQILIDKIKQLKVQ